MDMQHTQEFSIKRDSESEMKAILSTVYQALSEKGYKNGQVLYPARIALTGKESTPGGAIEMCLLLGKEESIRRINHSISLLKAKLGE